MATQGEAPRSRSCPTAGRTRCCAATWRSSGCRGSCSPRRPGSGCRRSRSGTGGCSRRSGTSACCATWRRGGSWWPRPPPSADRSRRTGCSPRTCARRWTCASASGSATATSASTPPRLGLAGHSMGGGCAVLAAAEDSAGAGGGHARGDPDQAVRHGRGEPLPDAVAAPGRRARTWSRRPSGTRGLIASNWGGDGAAAAAAEGEPPGLHRGPALVEPAAAGQVRARHAAAGEDPADGVLPHAADGYGQYRPLLEEDIKGAVIERETDELVG